MLKLTSYKCPNCGAALEKPEGRDKFFCNYCGELIHIENDTELVYRIVDEAKLRELDLKEAELKRQEEEKKRKAEEALEEIRRKEEEIKNKKEKLKHWKIGLIIAILPLLPIAIIGLAYEVPVLFAIVGVLIAICAWGIYKISEKEAKIDGKIKFTSSICTDNAHSTEIKLSRAGFVNIHLVNMRDLKIGILEHSGAIDNITIDGKEAKDGKWYAPDAVVCITYHGFPYEG